MKDGFMDMVMGRGSRDLPFSSDIKMIVRKSDFISDGTILIKANKSARDLRRDLIPRLRQGEIKVLLVASQDPLHNDEILRIVVNLFPSFLNSSQLVQDHGT